MGEYDSKMNLPPELDPEARSNAIRLTIREWIGVGMFTALLLVASPLLWKHVEKFELEPDYRMPKELSNDYWLYDRYTQAAAQRYDTLLVGDSVIWGEYVTRTQTLSHYLNERAGGERFGNLGLDGADPVSLAGLVEFYAAGVKNKKVLLLCNPLWLSSPRADLRTEESRLNHPRLAPQFATNIPCYPLTWEERHQLSSRIGIVVEQHVPFESWTAHLQQAYYRDQDGAPVDIPNWTINNPYKNPLEPLRQALPPSRHGSPEKPMNWIERGITKQDYPWVDLPTSLQWRSFQRVLEILQRRGDRVCVLVGPFNEHLLSEKNLPEYQRKKLAIVAWLAEKNVPHLVPAPVPSQLYADASHPLAAGYAELARQVYDWLGKRENQGR